MTASQGAANATPQPTGGVDDSRFDFDVAVVGLGNRGLLTALACHAAGLRVLAVDASVDRLLSHGAGVGDLSGHDHERLSSVVTDDRFQLTSDSATLSQARAVIVCVPTPVDSYFVPDMTALRGVCATVVDHAVADQLLLLTSITYVGCTEDLLVNPVTHRGFVVGTDIFVAFAAELIDSGAETGAEGPPCVVAGFTVVCGDRAVETLASFAKSVRRVPTIPFGETVKLLENTFQPVNIDHLGARRRDRHPDDRRL